MYETKAELKNVNLRNELAGEDSRVGAFDLKFELPFTEALHKLLCKNINKPIQLHALQDCGLESVKYSTEVEGVGVEFGDYHIVGAKMNNAVMKLSTTNVGSIRIQAQIGTQHGVVEAMNELCGEPLTLQVDEETLSIKILIAQMNLLDDGEDKSDDVAPKPAAENKSPSDKKPAPKKKKAKAKSKAKTKSKDKPAGKPQDGGATLHVIGDQGEDLTDEEIAQREAERDALLKRTVKSDDNSGNPELEQALDMILDLDKVKMGQGDEAEFHKLKERVDAGRALSMTESEKLNELYHRYAA